MEFRNKTFLRFTLIEWGVVLLIVLILARFFGLRKRPDSKMISFNPLGLTIVQNTWLRHLWLSGSCIEFSNASKPKPDKKVERSYVLKY